MNSEGSVEKKKETKITERFKKNPFLEDMIIPVKGKPVRLSRLGEDDNILLNQTTGEVSGTHVTAYKKVDAQEFLKVFTANIALTFGLKTSGIKMLNILCWAVQHKCLGKDEVDLDKYAVDDFLEAHKDNDPPLKGLSEATMKRGINELIRAKVIARTLRPGRFFINPNFMFNGDRIAFTTLIEKMTPEEEAAQKQGQ